MPVRTLRHTVSIRMGTPGVLHLTQDLASGLGVNPRDLPYPIDIVHPFLQLSIDSSNILIILSESRRSVVAYGVTYFSAVKQNRPAAGEDRAVGETRFGQGVTHSSCISPHRRFLVRLARCNSVVAVRDCYHSPFTLGAICSSRSSCFS